MFTVRIMAGIYTKKCPSHQFVAPQFSRAARDCPGKSEAGKDIPKFDRGSGDNPATNMGLRRAPGRIGSGMAIIELLARAKLGQIIAVL